MSTPSLPIKVLRASDPATLKLIHEYLDQNKGKLPDGKPITKLRRYVRKPSKPEAAGENIYSFKNQTGDTIQLALDESVSIFNAEDPKTRRLRIIKDRIAKGAFGRVKNVAKEPEVEFATIDPKTGQARVLKIASYHNTKYGTPSKETVVKRAELEKKLGESEGYVLRDLEKGGKIYIDLPKHPGKELFDYCAGRTFTGFDEKLYIAITILEQLKDRFHSKGYLHRDLKPDNILYEQETKKLRIIDLDFVEEAKKSSDKKHGTLFYSGQYTCGTPGYTAPEIVFKQEYSEKTDVYAVGILCAAALELSPQLRFTIDRDQSIKDIKPVDPNIHTWAVSDMENEKIILDLDNREKLKNLLLSMTNKDPSARPGVEEALKTLYEIRKVRQEGVKSITETKDVKTRVEDKGAPIQPKAITPQMQTGDAQRKTSSDKENTTPPPTSKPLVLEEILKLPQDAANRQKLTECLEKRKKDEDLDIDDIAYLKLLRDQNIQQVWFWKILDEFIEKNESKNKGPSK